MSQEIRMTLLELQDLLNDQKRETAEYITRNLTVYSWFKFDGMDIDDTKKQLKDQCLKSGYPPDFDVLKKYIKS